MNANVEYFTVDPDGQNGERADQYQKRQEHEKGESFMRNLREGF